MITTASEFYRLRTSDTQSEYDRAYREEAPEDVWLEVIRRYPDMREWVARNKTVPISILRLLADDVDPRVRNAVAGRRKLDKDLFRKLARDADPEIRGEIAHNKKVPEAVLEALTEDSEKWIAELALQRLNDRRNVEGPKGDSHLN